MCCLLDPFFKNLNLLPCLWLEEMNKYYMDEDD
jgi:hypothetical protein